MFTHIESLKRTGTYYRSIGVKTQYMCCIIYIDVVMRSGNRLMRVNCDTQPRRVWARVRTPRDRGSRVTEPIIRPSALTVDRRATIDVTGGRHRLGASLRAADIVTEASKMTIPGSSQ